ncbi:MAG: energy transducer TonB [Deltaproteobacteria bacterium]|nr:energy transducer TonB [Deltaproteobacteria bacterium]
MLQAIATHDVIFEGKFYGQALFWAVVVHAVALFVMLFPWPSIEPVRVLAQMEFELYDPLGGELGGGQVEEAAPESAPEPEPEPEEEPPQLLESTAPEAEEVIPPPPPPPVEKPKPKTPRLKPVQQTRGQPSDNPNSGGTGTGQEGSGQGGVGGGTGRGNPDALAAYKTRIQRRLERSKKYPPMARSNRIEGVVYVTFTINKDGRVVNSSISRSSGFPVLDDEAMGLLRRVNPLPSIPDEVHASVVTLTAPLQFKIR